MVGYVIAGVLLGAIGGALHLWVAHWRARLAVSGRPELARLSFPLGMLGPALCVIAAASVAPLAAWVSPLGLMAVRAAVLWRLRTAP